MKNEGETFGTYLKKLRIEEAQIGLRTFADLIEMAPSNLSNIERGRIPPPTKTDKLNQISDALGLPEQDERRTKLFDLAAQFGSRVPADIVQTIRENPGVPILVRTIANKQLDEEKLRELNEYIQQFY